MTHQTTHIEPSLARFLQRMEAVSAFTPLRAYDAPCVIQRIDAPCVIQRIDAPCVIQRYDAPAQKQSALDFDAAQKSLNGPGWYDSSWDLVNGLVVRESTAAGVGRLDDWAQCLFA